MVAATICCCASEREVQTCSGEMRGTVEMGSIFKSHGWLLAGLLSALTWCIPSICFAHVHCWLWLDMRKNVDQVLNCGNCEWIRGNHQRIGGTIRHGERDIALS